MWLAVTTTSLDDAMRERTRFSQLLYLPVFQQYLGFSPVHRANFERQLRVALTVRRAAGERLLFAHGRRPLGRPNDV
jgi:hypothetical protein